MQEKAEKIITQHKAKCCPHCNSTSFKVINNNIVLGVFNVQTINNYHSRLKAMIAYNFRRVSIKHLNNHLVYHNFVNFTKESQKEKEVILLDFIQKTYCKSLVKTFQIALQ